jgi:hypothetical protein
MLKASTTFNFLAKQTQLPLLTHILGKEVMLHLSRFATKMEEQEAITKVLYNQPKQLHMSFPRYSWTRRKIKDKNRLEPLLIAIQMFRFSMITNTQNQK